MGALHIQDTDIPFFMAGVMTIMDGYTTGTCWMIGFGSRDPQGRIGGLTIAIVIT